VHPRKKYPEKSLLSAFDRIGKKLENPINIHLLGGANLILRELKDSTKDIDIVLESKEAFQNLVKILKNQGYEKRVNWKGDTKSSLPDLFLKKKVLLDGISSSKRLRTPYTSQMR